MKACSRCSLFLGTTNPKRTVIAEHGAAWGIDDILNYLKETDDAPCPWRAGSAKKAVLSCPGRWPMEDRAFLCTLIPKEKLCKVEAITPPPLGAGKTPRLISWGSSLMA